MICPNFNDDRVRDAFNEILERFGGKRMEGENFEKRNEYKNGLDDRQRDAYHKAYYMWNKYDGNSDTIKNFMDAYERTKKAHEDFLNSAPEIKPGIFTDAEEKDEPPPKPGTEGTLLHTAYEALKDVWIGMKDVRKYHAMRENRELQKDLLNALNIQPTEGLAGTVERIVSGPEYKRATVPVTIKGKTEMFSPAGIDTAIHIKIDLMRDPRSIERNYGKVTAEQRRLVDLSQSLPAQVQGVVDKIVQSYKKLGEESMNAGLIQNIIENYVNRAWDIEGKGSEAYRKFGLRTGHAMQRVFPTILDGWALGYELRVEGATNSLMELKNEMSRTMANKKFIDAATKVKDIMGNPLLTTDKGYRRTDDYKLVDNPNFQKWESAGYISAATSSRISETRRVLNETISELRKSGGGGESAGVERAQGLVEGKVREALLSRGWTAAEAQQMIDRVKKAPAPLEGVESEKEKDTLEKTIERTVERTIEKEIRTELDVKGFGRDFFFGRDQLGNLNGMIFERRELYAPKDVADNLNNILGTSYLDKFPGIHAVTKYNAIFKSWILQTSFYHHLAFARNYYLGTSGKMWSEMSLRQAMKDGNKAIEENNPLIEQGVRNGLTLRLRQDWEEWAVQEKTIVGEILDKTEFTKDIKDRLLEIQEMQASWLFNEFGAGLKAKSYMIEFRKELERHPNEDPDVLSKRCAEVVNDNYGGLHLERLGRDPTLQHFFRLACLAPD
jgi:hypothetical protein